MGPPGNTAHLAVAAGGIEKLQTKPDPKKESGRNFQKIRDMKEKICCGVVK